MSLALAAMSLAMTVSAPSSEPGSLTQAKNLRVLPQSSSPAEVKALMEQYGTELGVKCEYCHTRNSETQTLDYASDDNPAKQTARVMIAMLNEINNKYLAQLDDQKYAVLASCGNCHRGRADPPEFEGFTRVATLQAADLAPQGPRSRVQWAATLSSPGVKEGDATTLELSGTIEDGWHVYALTQPAGGPTALRVTLDDNQVALATGVPSGPRPQKRHDPSFGLESRFYTHAFTIRVPVQLKQQSVAGRQNIPISVRFQSCSDRECQPPTTIHLLVPVDVLP